MKPDKPGHYWLRTKYTRIHTGECVNNPLEVVYVGNVPKPRSRKGEMVFTLLAKHWKMPMAEVPSDWDWERILPPSFK